MEVDKTWILLPNGEIDYDAEFKKYTSEEILEFELGKYAALADKAFEDTQSYEIFIRLMNIDTYYTRLYNMEQDRQQNIVAEHRLLGMQYEEEGDIDNAIKEYETSVSVSKELSLTGFSNYAYSLERLFVLYRKNKEYKKEIEAIEYFLSVCWKDRDYSKYEKRLEKAKNLYNKSMQ